MGHRASSSREVTEDVAQPVIAGPRDVQNPAVTPDGNWIVYTEMPKQAGGSAPQRLMRIPIAGGAPQFVLEARNGWPMCARAPASLCAMLEESAGR